MTRQVFGWCMYDWANSAFATTIMATVLPIFFSNVAANNLPKNMATSYWGYTNSVAMLIIILITPILGILADMRERRKFYLSRFILIGCLSTGCLVLIGEGAWLWVSMLYILGRIGFSGGNVFYDSLLPFIANENNIDSISALGYTLGYLGGGLLLLLNMIMIQRPHLFGLRNTLWGTRASFLSVAFWWGAFSVPLFCLVHEPQTTGTNPRHVSIKDGYKGLLKTFLDIKRYREVWKFLIAYWLYNDGISTIIIMASIFGTEIGISQKHLLGAILLVQFLGVPFTLLFAMMSKYLKTKYSILIGLGGYIIIAVCGFFIKTPFHFWMLAVLVSMVQGGTQALSRSFFGRLIPKRQSAEFFAFYDISAKFSGIIGPAIFGFIGQFYGSSRYGIFSMVLFFLGGGILLSRINDSFIPYPVST